MRTFRRQVLAWLSLAGLFGMFLAPASVSADPLTSWTPGPDAILDNTYDGFIDTPTMNASVPSGNFTVAGWFVDKTAEGWAGADDVQVWLGTMDGGGRLLTRAMFAQSRPDVAAAEGNPYWAASGFGAVIPGGSLSAGPQTLSVYAHTAGKGWWYRQVKVNVSAAAAAAPVGTVSGGALPIVVIEQPTPGQDINTRNPYTIVGYALDKNA
ncbi:MAG TPA: hypothetical protein VF937_01090, partial [Chloroflexota bacterium]